jgi:ParB/RepB/Spo0J family partition protein
MAEASQILNIPLGKLMVSRFNVRRELGDLSELVDSIKAVGVLQPIVVRPVKKDRYEVVVGSRRFAAAKEAKLKAIPAIVKEMSDDEAIIESLVENIQRGDLEIEEIASAFNSIQELDPKRWTYEAFAREIGKSKQWLSGIVTAVQSLYKLRAMGKPYRTKVHPTREEREKGILPIEFLKEVEYALKSEEVRKAIPEEKIDDVRVKLIEVIKDLDYDDAKKVIDYFKMYPEKPIEEVREMALARKAGVELKTYVPASVMRRVEETAEKIGRPVEVILPEVLEKGVEVEAKKIELEESLKSAPEYIVVAARKPESRLTARIIEKLKELPEEKQKAALRYIENLRLTEEEAIEHIEALKAPPPSLPEKEIEKMRERYEQLKEEIRKRLETPEAKLKGELFRNWSTHIAFSGALDSIFCPVCKSKQLGWICHGLTIQEALTIAEENYKKTVKGE